MSPWSPSPGGRQSYHHGNLRQAIIECAVRRARREGGDAIVLREIAAEVGVSPTAAYRHFSSREQLVSIVAAMGLDQIAERARRAPVTDDGNVPESDRALLAAYADLMNVGVAFTEFAIAEPAWTRLVVTQLRRAEDVRASYAAVRAVVDEALDRGCRAGVFVDATRVQRQTLRVGLTGLVSAIVMELAPTDTDDRVEPGVRAGALAASIAPLLTERGRELVAAAGPVPEELITDLVQWPGSGDAVSDPGARIPVHRATAAGPPPAG